MKNLVPTKIVDKNGKTTTVHKSATKDSGANRNLPTPKSADTPTYITCEGVQIWQNADGQFHRDDDKPAIIYDNGAEAWYKDGQLHRDGDKPAFVGDGVMVWYRNGVRHRDGDKPAIIESDGSQMWYKEGTIHRGGDKPAWINADGLESYYKHGEFLGYK